MRDTDGGDLIMLIGGILIGAGVVGSFYAEQTYLPYSRPHIEFENEEGKDCVGWYMNGGAGAIMLCEGKPPKIVLLKQTKKQGYKS